VRTGEAISGRCTRVLRRHGHFVLTVAFSLDGNLLISGSKDSSLRVWNLKNPGSEPIKLASADEVGVAAFSPKGDHSAVSLYNGEVRLLSARTFETRQTMHAHDDWIMGMEFTPDSRYLITASGDKTVRIWPFLE
jgi:WD40 repeat protein